MQLPDAPDTLRTVTLSNPVSAKYVYLVNNVAQRVVALEVAVFGEASQDTTPPVLTLTGVDPLEITVAVVIVVLPNGRYGLRCA